MINAQLNTLKTMGISRKQPFEPCTHFLANTISAGQQRLGLDWNFGHNSFKAKCTKIANQFPWKTIIKLLFRNVVVAFILKTLKYLIGNAATGLGRIMNHTRDVMFATAEAFFIFMDDFFMMDEEVELLVITNEENAMHPQITKTGLNILKSRFSRQASAPFIPGFNFKIGFADKAFQVDRFIIGDHVSEGIQRYFRPFLFRTLNLFKPVVFKLPLKHSFYSHQTPV